VDQCSCFGEFLDPVMVTCLQQDIGNSPSSSSVGRSYTTAAWATTTEPIIVVTPTPSGDDSPPVELLRQGDLSALFAQCLLCWLLPLLLLICFILVIVILLLLLLQRYRRRRRRRRAVHDAATASASGADPWSAVAAAGGTISPNMYGNSIKRGWESYADNGGGTIAPPVRQNSFSENERRRRQQQQHHYYATQQIQRRGGEVHHHHHHHGGGNGGGIRRDNGVSGGGGFSGSSGVDQSPYGSVNAIPLQRAPFATMPARPVMPPDPMRDHIAKQVPPDIPAPPSPRRLHRHQRAGAARRQHIDQQHSRLAGIASPRRRGSHGSGGKVYGGGSGGGSQRSAGGSSRSSRPHSRVGTPRGVCGDSLGGGGDGGGSNSLLRRSASTKQTKKTIESDHDTLDAILNSAGAGFDAIVEDSPKDEIETGDDFNAAFDELLDSVVDVSL